MGRTEQQEMSDVSMGRPHVVILGAGASRAAFPNGDKHGRKLPVMNDFAEVLELEPLLDDAEIEHAGRNFEELYGALATGNDHRDLMHRIEKEVFSYFARLQLPDNPTIYDHLLLSLRDKDVVATFNWDPFLMQAYRRNRRFASLPRTIYLHGNVAVGYCADHRPITFGARGALCGKCGKPLADSPLLYPVQQKGYTKDRFISSGWRDLRVALQNAYVLTIFGYGAPQSDVEAIGLMKVAWGGPGQRNLEQIEIIDIRDEDDLADTWSDFIHSHHYQTCKDFYESFIAGHPRRSCESMWAQLMDIQYISPRRIPKHADFTELWDWYAPLIKVEKSRNTGVEATGHQ